MPRTLIGNFKGPKGDTGPTGPQGVQGPQGPAGTVDGNSVIDFEVPETYAPPESGNPFKVLIGKITKGLSDLFAAVGVLASLKTVDKTTLVAAINELAEGKLDIAKIVASTNITEPGFLMDGKTTADALTELYSKKIPSFEVVSQEFHGDCDTIVHDGLFNQIVSPDCQNGPDFYAYILVLRYPSGNVTQIAFGYNSKNFAMRYKYAGNWAAWRKF